MLMPSSNGDHRRLSPAEEALDEAATLLTVNGWKDALHEIRTDPAWQKARGILSLALLDGNDPLPSSIRSQLRREDQTERRLQQQLPALLTIAEVLPASPLRERMQEAAEKIQRLLEEIDADVPSAPPLAGPSAHGEMNASEAEKAGSR